VKKVAWSDLIFETCLVSLKSSFSWLPPHKVLTFLLLMKLLSITCVTILLGLGATAVSDLRTITPVNVGGHKYEVHRKLLDDHPESNLTQLLKKDNSCGDDPVFIDRNPYIFPLVLDASTSR